MRFLQENICTLCVQRKITLMFAQEIHIQFPPYQEMHPMKGLWLHRQALLVHLRQCSRTSISPELCQMPLAEPFE